ncbi:prepilin-type N-terminal cleavage/methylation domain-containing protein [Massilia aerilata]|uniref:Prepilin-type N-terminal cleavage/methylation domain-containing protein n=1 Tax=Massilia aerilata TaxID=453817 RepID=A0ABW0S5K4_9BURK
MRLTGWRRRGFSFVEVLVAVAVLALCAVPLAEAVRNGIAASTIGAAKARELRCMKSMMETVLAEPYPNLANAALGKDTPSSYSRPADAACLARRVYIAKSEWEYGKSLVFLDNSAASWRLESALLYVNVSSPDGTYSFTTLVSR